MYPLLAHLLLLATNFFVSSTGNDTNPGTSKASPWLTFDHAVKNRGCGNVLNIDNVGTVSAGTVVPYLGPCSTPTYVRSYAWNMFQPWKRIDPVNDQPFTGKFLVTGNQDIQLVAETHGSLMFALGTISGCGFNIPDSSHIQPTCTGLSPGFANDTQVSFDMSLATLTETMPTNVPRLTKFWVENCVNCNTGSGSMQLSLAQGGPPITGIVCSGTCILSDVTISIPLQVNTSTGFFTAVDYPFTSAWKNGMPFSFGVGGASAFGTAPAPFSPSAQYWVCNFTSPRFQACDAFGNIIMPTDIGIGPLDATSNQIPEPFIFQGVEATTNQGPAYGYIWLGAPDTSNPFFGSPRYTELDHVYLYQSSGDTNGVQKGLYENSNRLWIHQSNFSGFTSGETQAINGCNSPGPTLIESSSLSAAGEVILYGGCGNTSGVTNAKKIIRRNVLQKPSVWKRTTNTSGGALAPIAPCFHTPATIDPNHPGGEYYIDPNSGLNYQCQPGGTSWATVGSVPALIGIPGPEFKNIVEQKNGAYFDYYANVLTGSWVAFQTGQIWNDSAEAGSGPGTQTWRNQFHDNLGYNIYTPFVRVNQCNSSPNYQCLTPGGDSPIFNNLSITHANGCGVQTASGNAQPSCNGFNSPTLMQPNSHVSSTWEMTAHNTTWGPPTGLSPNGATVIYTGDPSGMCMFSPDIYNVSHLYNLYFGDAAEGDCLQGSSGIIGAYYNTSTFQYNNYVGSRSNYTGNGTNTFANNSFPAANSNVGWNGADGTPTISLYALTSASPSSMQNGSGCAICADGTDNGVDTHRLSSLTSNVIAGLPSWSDISGLTFTVGSTNMLLTYTAPTNASCTANIYNGPAPITANLVTSVVDTSSNSVSAATDRQLVIPSLTPGAQVWGELTCGSETIPFQQTMRATGSKTLNTYFPFVTNTVMQYSASADMSSPTVLSAATLQAIPCAANSRCYAQIGTAGRIWAIVTP